MARIHNIILGTQWVYNVDSFVKASNARLGCDDDGNAVKQPGETEEDFQARKEREGSICVAKLFERAKGLIKKL